MTASGRANRWNYNKEWVIYCAGSRSLAALELVAHRSGIVPTFEYETMVIEFPDRKSLLTKINPDDLPKNWRRLSAYDKLQKIGSNWYNSQDSLVLQIPSVLIPQEHNYMINTKHPAFKNVKLKELEAYYWDKRLL